MKLGVGACEPAMVEAFTVPHRGTKLSRCIYEALARIRCSLSLEWRES